SRADLPPRAGAVPVTGTGRRRDGGNGGLPVPRHRGPPRGEEGLDAVPGGGFGWPAAAHGSSSCAVLGERAALSSGAAAPLIERYRTPRGRVPETDTANSRKHRDSWAGSGGRRSAEHSDRGRPPAPVLHRTSRVRRFDRAPRKPGTGNPEAGIPSFSAEAQVSGKRRCCGPGIAGK